jgi:hypothetical protein
LRRFRSIFLALRLAYAPLLFTVAACGKSAAKQEAERIITAIERVQMAPPDGRKDVLEALEKESAKGELAEKARSSCARAYRAMHDAKDRIAALEKRVAAHRKAGTTPEHQVIAELILAQAGLDEAQKGMDECQTALRELRLSLH